jgi:putative NIF3 family GTP cyclohydrolase 1 type 2
MMIAYRTFLEIFYRSLKRASKVSVSARNTTRNSFRRIWNSLSQAGLRRLSRQSRAIDSMLWRWRHVESSCDGCSLIFHDMKRIRPNMLSLRIVPIVLALLSVTSQAQTMTAGDAIHRIQRRYAAAPPPDTVDTIKVGDPSTVVTGITTTFLDTMDVLRESVKRGNNLIITHEPTFYNHRDDTKNFTDDPVYKEKRAFIEKNHLVVFRLHDEIHSGEATDHILKGVYAAMGWEDYAHPAGPQGQYFVTIPKTTLREIANKLQARLHDQTMRVEGDPKLPITHVALLPGASGLEEQVAALRQPDVELLIAGEASEWETVEYVRDAVAQGRHKAMILLGHEVSEEPGMEQCAKELRELFPGVRVDHIEAGQPLWNPEHGPVVKKQ